MISEYIIHNLYWEDPSAFAQGDPQLSQLRDLKFVHPLDWWREIDLDDAGIYILTGGRQIGKSTSLKLFIKHLLDENRILARNVFYLPCDQIDDHHQLSRIVRSFLGKTVEDDFLLVLDEITFVRGWDRTIKALADEGRFRKGSCILTGSDSVILKEAAARFPGRRGHAPKTDFEIHPLSFREYVELTAPSLLAAGEQEIDDLFDAFDRYLVCGGYLRAINDLESRAAPSEATRQTFEQWIRGDFDKRGKKTKYLEEILTVVYETSTSQITYSRLAEKTSGISKETLIDYCHMLERMGILHVLEAFDQNKLRGFPKKARKIHFSDPFIAGVIGSWLQRERYIDKLLEAPTLVESLVASNLRRVFPVYYIKAAGEVDVVVIKDREFIPIEVKWTKQTRVRDLKQIKKYPNAIILSMQRRQGEIDGIRTIPLPRFLISPDTSPARE